MPEGVVHALEVVEVEEHHCGRVVVARQRSLDAQREQGAIGEPRQRIVPGLVRQPLLERRHRGQGARRLAALERAARMRPDRLQQAPLTQAERLAALDCEQPDDAGVPSQCDDDRSGQSEARQPRPALLTGVREVDHGGGLELLEQRALGRRGLAGERTAGALAPVDLRAQDAALGRVQDERGTGRADQRTGMLEQHARSRLGAGGGVHVAHDRQQRLDLRALAALTSVCAIGQPAARRRARPAASSRRAREPENRALPAGRAPGSSTSTAERDRDDGDGQRREPGGEGTAARGHRALHRPLRQTPVWVVNGFSMKEIADKCSTGALARVARRSPDRGCSQRVSANRVLISLARRAQARSGAAAPDGRRRRRRGRRNRRSARWRPC